MFDTIIELICKGEKLPIENVYLNTNRNDIVYPRQLIMFFAMEFKLNTQAIIGAKFNRDHATVYHACLTINNLYSTDLVKRNRIDEYRKKLKGIEQGVKMVDVLKEEMKLTITEISKIESRLINLQLMEQNIEQFIENL
jgi:hypothetical protein